ncbi:MAG: hypothetical protein IKP77_06955 [Acholeplasmatales bacterium]|nr:hypothetical protein [Acholeplasmatales bacterium]
MELNLEKNVIVLYGKSYKYDGLLRKLTSLSGNELYHFISNRGIALPRKMNCMAMFSVLNEKIKYLHSKSLSKDYFTRLQSYKDFGETQLTELFKTICDDDDYFKYRYNLLNLIFINYAGLALNDGEVQYLRNVKKTGLENFETYSSFVSACSLEQEGTFDGVDFETLKNNLLVSASAQDILKLGEKYGIEIPQYLTKEQYYDFIVYYLKKKDIYTEEIDNELKEMTLGSLTTYCRRNGVPLSPSLSKEDYITYLFYYLEGCEIANTSIKMIISDPIYDPVDFSFDLSQINVFGGDEAKRIVKFNGDDDPEYVERINYIIDKINRPNETTFIPFAETETIGAPIRPGEQKMDDGNDDFELEDYELEEIQDEESENENSESEDSNDVNDESNVEVESDNNENELVNNELLEDETVNNEPMDFRDTEVNKEKIDITNVIVNDLYGSKKLKELKNGNRKIVLLSISLTIVVLILGFVIFALAKR